MTTDAVLLLWLPLGAGGHVVSLNGRVFEAISAARQHRPRASLFHAALEVRLDGSTHVIEMTPEWGNGGGYRGVVATGPVGSPLLGRSRFFRYEVRAWRDGTIPDAEYAVDSPVRVSADRSKAARILALAPSIPTLTWGRDELGVGDMWNSNSLVAWLLARSGHDMTGIRPPGGGRAPGWQSGLALAARDAVVVWQLPRPPAR